MNCGIGLRVDHECVHDNDAVIVLTKRLEHIPQVSIDLVKLGIEVADTDQTPVFADRELAGNMEGIDICGNMRRL